MIRLKWKQFWALLIALLCLQSAHAHIGNKDIYQTVTAGPYKLFVTVRMPLVIPGLATVEVRSSEAPIHHLTIAPLPLTGEASKHPPAADTMTPSSIDPAFYTGSLWIMDSGAWQIRFNISGDGGTVATSVPVTALATGVLRMQLPLTIMLALSGCVLVVGSVAIVTAAAREARLVPGASPGPAQRRSARIAAIVAVMVCTFMVWLGGRWLHGHSTAFAAGMHRNLKLGVRLNGNSLHLSLENPDTDPDPSWKEIDNDGLLPDHGHLMHLYAIRWPEMDAIFHLHPVPVGKSGFDKMLPAMPAGTYRLYADVVFRDGFPETETATLTVPAGMTGASLGYEDAGATPPALSTGTFGPVYKFQDGYSMVWDKPPVLTANAPYNLTFHLIDGRGKPAADMQPYLGMVGHAVFVKSDGTAYAHTHPDGSASMPAVMLANEGLGLPTDGTASGNQMEMPMDMAMNMSTEPISSIAAFPYGFPSAGRYRIVIQMKHSGTIETGVFDVNVQ